MSDSMSTQKDRLAIATSKQVTLLTCHLYDTPYQKWQGFRNMGLAPGLFKNIPGLVFAKMLGSGGGNGFSLWPNWGRYFSLTVWESETAAREYILSHNKQPSTAINRLRRYQSSEWSVILKPFMAHGNWDKQSPFDVESVSKPHSDQAIAVLTRARIKFSKLYRFWRDVPNVSRSMESIEGCTFAAGVGELPLIQQATFSIWENEVSMKSFAYSSAHHKAAVKKTRQVGWYSEELFARFKIIDVTGQVPVSVRKLLGSTEEASIEGAS